MRVTALTPAQRKRAQRERDRAALWALGVSLDTLLVAGCGRDSHEGLKDRAGRMPATGAAAAPAETAGRVR